jgi:hypothetical protein
LEKIKNFRKTLPIDTEQWALNHWADVEEVLEKELEYVKEQSDNLIWTVIEEDGVTCFIQGFHFVNRFQYLIATVPYKRGDKETYYDAVDDWCIECDGGQEENENCKECGGKGYYEYR